MSSRRDAAVTHGVLLDGVLLTADEHAAICAAVNAYPRTVIVGASKEPTMELVVDPAHLTGPTQAAADAIAGKLDLARWERNGWPTVDRDLAAVATPAVLRWAHAYLHAWAGRLDDDAVAVGYQRAADELEELADRLDPAPPPAAG